MQFHCEETKRNQNIISEFNSNEKILVKNIDLVKMKIEKIKDMGNTNLSIFTDFDKTLTRCYNKSENADTSFTVLSYYEGISIYYKIEEKKNYEYYRAIEVSKEIDEETKIESMEKWWLITQERMIKEGLQKEKIILSIINSKFLFRYVIDTFLNFCCTSEISVNIISAGLRTVIIESLKWINNKLHPLVLDKLKYFSGNEIFNENNILVGFEKPLITCLNKHLIIQKYDKLTKNAIIMGDLIADLDMIKGINFENSIKIGFYNFKDNRSLNEYLDCFDIVIMGDGNLSTVIYILGLITNSPINIEIPNIEYLKSIFE